MKTTEKGVIVKGYKATDENMKCRGFQFELGKWYEHDGEIELCKSGFHFCEHPSGPWSFYSSGRLFSVEAEYVVKSEGPGADLKHVAKRIRFVSEVAIGGNWNTGNRNTGDWNTGERNTGDWNTGNGNTGHRNTGNGNIGDGNTGNGNCCDFSSGYFNTKEQPIVIFDKRFSGKRSELTRYDCLISDLEYALSRDDEFDCSRFLGIPNATEKKIKALHRKHIAARSKGKSDE